MVKHKHELKTNKITEDRIAKMKASSQSSDSKEQPMQDPKKKVPSKEENETNIDDLRSTETEEDRIIPFLCEPCRVKRKRQDAVGFCDTCLDFLCGDCIETHKKGRLLRTHVHNILERIEVPREPDTDNVTREVCKCMSGFVKFYCKDHKCLVCKTCKTYTHKRCHVASVVDIADDFVDSKHFKNEMKELLSIRNKCEKVRKSCQSDINKISTTFTDILEEVKQIRRKITDAIDRFEEDIKRELNKLFAREEKLIRDKKVKCELLKSTAEKKISNVDKLKEENNDVEIFVSFHKSLGETKKLQESLNALQKDTDKPEVTFTKNSVIDMFLQTDRLGELNVDKITKSEPQKEVKPLWDKRRMLWSPDIIPEDKTSDRTKPKSETFVSKQKFKVEDKAGDRIKPKSERFNSHTKIKDGLKSAPLTDIRNATKRSVKSDAPKALGGDHKKGVPIPPIQQYTSKRSSHLHVKRKAVMEQYRVNRGVFY